MRSTLTPEQTEQIRARFLAGETTEQLATTFTVERATIQRAIRGLAKQRPPAPSDVERFWAKVDREGGPTACWHWLGGQSKGRGQFVMQGTTHQAHRLAYQLTYGPIPARQVLIPECKDWLCVNPDHWVMEEQHIPHVAGEAHGQAKLTDAQVAAIRSQHAAGGVTLQALAEAHGVRESTIRKYVRGQRRHTAAGPIAPSRRSTPPPKQAARDQQPRTEVAPHAPPSRSTPAPKRAAATDTPPNTPRNQLPPRPTPAPLPQLATPPAAPAQPTRPHDHRQGSSGRPVAARSIERPRVLLAAIDDLAALLLETQLRELGYPLAGIVRRVDDLLVLATRQKPAVILLDRRISDRDTFDLIRRLSGQQRAPVVLLDTSAESSAMQRAAASGAFGYLVLPAPPSALEAAITFALARAADIDNLRKQIEEMKETLATRKVVERAKGIVMRRYNLDENEAYERLRRYARDRGITIRKIAETIVAGETEASE